MLPQPKDVARIAPALSCLLMRIARNSGIAPPDQEVEVTAAVRLQHVVDVQALVAAGSCAALRLPRIETTFELCILHEQVQSSRRNVEGDAVAVSYECKRTSNGGLWCDVQHDSAIGCATHSGVRQAHHICDAACEQLCGQAHVSHFSHARIALWSAVLEDHHTGFINVQIWILNLLAIVLNGLENDGTSRMFHQRRTCC